MCSDCQSSLGAKKSAECAEGALQGRTLRLLDTFLIGRFCSFEKPFFLTKVKKAEASIFELKDLLRLSFGGEGANTARYAARFRDFKPSE